MSNNRLPPRRRSTVAKAALLLVALIPALGACSTAPGTGRSIFTGGMSAEDEAQLGADQHEQVLAEFGGAYDDPELNRYVTSIGELLVSTSETPNKKFTFTILNTPIVNAFALPGGYVYVTRGTLALATDEAELAAVMAHEIGHVTARHSAERYGQTMAAKIASVGLGVLLGSGAVAQAADTASTLIVRGYSRDQESEADLLGVRYLARVGYDPIAMAGFLERLQAHSRLEAELRGKPGAADDFSLLQTHPRTADRIVLASQQAGVTEVRDPMTRRDVYLRNLDGMIYGDDPEQGFVRGQTFLHPKLRFAFEVPEGFSLINGATQVTAAGPEGSLILFDRAPKEAAGAGSMQAYLTQQWGRQLQLSNVEAIQVNGMEAATGATRVNTNSGERDLRLVAIRYDSSSIYRFLFATPPDITAGLNEGLKRTTYSFRKLDADEAANLKPLRLRIHEVKAGETAESLAQQMAGEVRPLDRFRVLNGLAPDAPLTPGTLVKLVRE